MRGPRSERPLALSSAGVFLVSLAIQLIGFVASLYLYKHIGTDDPGKGLLGTIQLYLIIGSSINGIADLRLGSAFTFFVARGKPAEQSLGTYFFLRMAMVGLAGLTLFAIAPYPVFGQQLVSNGTALTVLGVFLALPLLWSVSTVYNQLWVAEGDSLKAQLPLLIESIVRTPVLVYVALYDPTLTGITYAYLVGAIASFFVSLPDVLRRIRPFRATEAKEMFRYAWPLMGSLVLLFLATNSIPLIVNAKLGVINLNLFLAANGFRILALSLPAAISVPLFPYLANRHQEGEYEAIRSGTWRALRYTAMLLVPGVVALVVYRVNFLYILANGTYVSPAAIPLAILVVSAIPLALSQIISTALSAIGKQRLELYITSLQVGVLFGAAFLLLPPVTLLPAVPGLIGASIAVLLSSVAALGLNTFFMERLMAVRIQPRSILSIVASGTVSFLAVSRLFNPIVPVNRYYQLAAGVALGYLVYFLMLALIGELTKEDVRQITSSIGMPARVADLLGRLCWRADAPQVNQADLRLAPGLRPLELPETFSGEREIPELTPGRLAESSEGDGSAAPRWR